MNVAKGPIPQLLVQSCDQCFFFPKKVGAEVGVVPHINLPQTFPDILSSRQDQQSTQGVVLPRKDTGGISSSPVLSSQSIELRSSADQEDSELLHCVAVRAETALDAFTKLYTRHHEKLRRFCHIFLRNPDRVEEVMQEVWLDVWTEAGTYRGEAKVTTWIFGRAKNHCQNKWRKEEQKDPHHLPIVSTEPQDISSPGMEISASAIEDPEANESLDPSVKVEVKVRNQVLLGAIARLSPLDQAMLHLVYREGKSLREVSQILGKPEGTVKRRLSDTRRTLRKELEKQGSI